MKIKLLTFLGTIFLAGITFLALSGSSSAQSINVDQKAQQNNTTQQKPSEQQAVTGQYTYKARVNDSYSVLARKAIQTYGIETKTNLSPAQIIFAETNLTQAASSPLLEVGQQISINKETVKNWVDKAKTLTTEQQSAWNYYVQFVEFNTNNNG